MRIYTFLLVIIFAAAVSACWSDSAENTNLSNAADSENSAVVSDAENADGENSSTADEAGSNETSGSKNLSPSETLEAFNEASNKKDVEAIRNLLSQRTLEMVDKKAKEEGKTFGDLIKEEDGMPPIETPEIRNEKISGETATIEIKNGVTGAYNTLPFVKENGVWKIAFVKFIEDNIKKANEQMDVPEGK